MRTTISVVEGSRFATVKNAITSSVSIDLQNCSGLEGVPDQEQIREWVAGALLASNTRDATEINLAVRLVGTDESRALNKRYRQHDNPTNVLSFPFDGLAGLPAVPIRSLGDLVICVPLVEREAGEQDKNANSHWAHIVIHGTLHLLGYDHQDDEQAAVMETLESRVLKTFGIQNPYLDI